MAGAGRHAAATPAPTAPWTRSRATAPLQAHLAAALQPGPTRSVLALSGSLGLVSLVLDRWGIGLSRGDVRPLVLLLLALAFAVAETAVVHLEVDSNAYSISASEACLAVALLTGSPTEAIAARLLGGLLVLLFRRRQRPIKMIFNLCSWSMEVTIALLVFQGLNGSPAGLTSAWPAAAGATLAAGIWQTASVCVAISIYSGRLSPQTLRSTLLPALASAVGGCTVAIIAVGALRWDPLALIPLGLCALLLAVGYQGYARLRARNAVLQRLYDVTRRMSRSATNEQTLDDLLGAVRDLLRAEVVELVIGDDPGGMVHTLVGPDRCTSTPMLAGFSDWAHARTLTGGEALLMRATSKHQLTRAYLAARGYRDCLLVPLSSESDIPGTLRVANRVGDVATFGVEDVKLLQTVASQAAVALENTRLLERLNYESRHDPLTGLANRTHFQDRVELSLAAGEPNAILVMDLDRFKEINDTLGHHHGDLLLVEVTRRLHAQLRRVDQLARLGGDEFAVQLTGAELEDAIQAAQRMHRALAEPITIDGISVNVQASIGIALAPSHGNVATTLLRRADVAMYSAKRGHSGMAVYEASQDDLSPRRLTLASELREAISAGQLELYYQPQLSTTTGQVVGAEALVRWRHPDYGLVCPDEFLPLAEQTGQIRQLTRWVIRSAVAQAAAWQQVGLQIDVSINVSVRNLLELDLPDFVTEVIKDAQLRPNALTIEVTESHIMADPDRTLGVLRRLNDNGLRLSIDDFGTGYSSLAHLRLMPVQELKIDKSFVRGLAEGDDGVEVKASSNIIRSILSLAQSLNLEVVAEGVEDQATADHLAAMGCGRLQGFHFSRPIPAVDFTVWHQARQGAAVGLRRPRLRAVPFASPA